MTNKSTQHVRILNVLLEAQTNRTTFFFRNVRLPVGWVPTGILHNAAISGTSARTRISELNKKYDLRIESKRINEDRFGNPLRNPDGSKAHVYAYRLGTADENKINQIIQDIKNNGKHKNRTARIVATSALS